MKKGAAAAKNKASKASSPGKGSKATASAVATPPAAAVVSKKQGTKKGAKSAAPATAPAAGRDAKLPALQGNEYLTEVRELQDTLPHWGSLFSEKANRTRAEEWVRLSVIGGAISDKYAWAIPDERALRIISNFAPLVEVAAGKGYWGRLLQERGVDIACFDKHVSKGAWSKVTKGDHNVLKDPAMRGRALLLSYPDEDASVGADCLRSFHGEYVIHVGELISTGTVSGMAQSSWGRTSTSEFQVLLTRLFHNVLTVKLPTFPFGLDYLTVWKRTRYVDINEHDFSAEDVTSNPALHADYDADDHHGEDSIPAYWADIPLDERVPDFAAQKFAHLLE